MNAILSFLVTVIIAFILSFVILFVSLWGFQYKVDIEKTAVYECGFSPFLAPRVPFDVKFYLVSLLFIVFDIEMLILCPFAINHNFLMGSERFLFVFFIFFIFLGIVYEIKTRVLDF
jgi:NADH:ubiquinone oxidoreductase subunit 3 (subunit A)